MAPPRIYKFILLDHLICVVVVDMNKVEAGIRKLNPSEIHKIDADGIRCNRLHPAVIKARRKGGLFSIFLKMCGT